MELEIQVSVNFLMNFLYNKLPRRRVDLFGDELARKLRKKFEGHWYPAKPTKGSAYRCILITHSLDPVLASAAQESGLKIEDVKANLPEKLCLWIDPLEVSYRIGEQGSVNVIYKKENTTIMDEISDAETARWVDLLNGHNNSFKSRNAERASSPTFSSGSSNSSSSSPVLGQSFAKYFAWSTAEDAARKPRARPARVVSPLSPSAQEFSPIKAASASSRPWTFPRTIGQEVARRSPILSSPTNMDWFAHADNIYRENFLSSQMPIMA